MEEYLEKVILAKAQLEQANKFLMNLVAFLVRDFELPWDFTGAQLVAVPPINIKSEDGMVYTVSADE